MDDDGVGTTNIPVKLKITVPPHGSNRKVLFDFAGTGPQVKGNINATMSATSAGVLYSLKALLDPDVPNNQGLIDLVDITAPLGSLLNAKFPAAVAARANTSQRIVDVVIGAGYTPVVATLYTIADLVNLVALALTYLAVAGKERY